MGFIKRQKNISNKSNYFKFNGLIFESEEDYKILKNIDKNIKNIVKLVKKDKIDIEEVFTNLKVTKVEETYPDACDELDRLFKNATSLLFYEGMADSIEYKVACKFLNKISIIEYEEEYNY